MGNEAAIFAAEQYTASPLLFIRFPFFQVSAIRMPGKKKRFGLML